MKEFMTTHKIFLTPISPIHIGCGEDFEPTNYVIDGNMLYHFEPSKLPISKEQRKELLNLSSQEYVDETQLFELQGFFSKNDEIINGIKDIAHYKILVSTAITKEWKEKLGNPTQIKENGKAEGNRFYIARHSYSPYLSNVYIPGSSVKGAVFSAIIQSKHQNKPLTDKDLNLDKGLGNNKKRDKGIFSAANKKLIYTYIGDFNRLSNEKIISQYIKFSDLMPNTKFSHFSKVIYSVNLKRTKGKKGYSQGISTRMECIQPELYRGFQGELTLTDISPEKSLSKDFYQSIIKMLNDFYRPIFDKECQLFIQNGFINSLFFENINLLLNTNKIALIRLGKNGSESKLLAEKSLKKINIKGEYKEQSNTFWLASEKNDAETQLQPLGWALLEFSPIAENELLQ
ncbi:type III-A CRISPR-associated RAMP protein Csm5 [Caviibacterium pharyngocola]|uniref:CRISPR system Cms protein Csm5 n=1 Tax=Caviibacterium pharyngocola TaxID=28159 RepID=A0A2M8RU51_9PAST|nr:type III-A CRISPR-associated RAMP protein Csm5 [Caviibacterium pharyngocola]PJG82416.1 type III-A CRISPR-associated RAMP protein Csm5 [Caviibacterium pharyngocola]